MKLIKHIKKMIRSGGIDEPSFQAIKKEMNASNHLIMKYFTCMAVVTLACMVVLSIVVRTLSVNRPIYLTGFVIVLAMWATATFVSEEKVAVHEINMYLFTLVLLGVGVALGTYLGPKEISATYIAFLLTVPQVFTDRPYRMILIIIVSVAAFILIALEVKDPMTWSSDITNAVLFGFMSIFFCTYSISTRVSKLALEERIRFLAARDRLTGLGNRYSYEETVTLVSGQEVASVYCVYVDVNGLHELNNTKGHEAGDRMLQKIAALMQETFGEEETYRIGGDEFVAIGMNRTPEEVRTCTEELKERVEKAGYHIAAGIGFREKNEISVENLVKTAEKEMYNDKSDYYLENGIDRRRR